MNLRKNLEYYLILLSVVLIPLALRLSADYLTDQETMIYGVQLHSDIFNMFKAKLFVVFVAVIFIIVILKWLLKKLEFVYSLEMLLILIIGITIFLSAMISDYGDTVWLGGFESYQGVGLQICYLVFALLVMQIIRVESEIEGVLRAISYGVLVMGVICLTQFLGFNIINWYPVKYLIAGQEMASNVNVLAFNSKQVYGTLGNPNYIGCYVALLFPMYVYLVIKSKKNSVLYRGSLLVCSFMLFASESDAALLSVGVSVMLLLSMFSLNELKDLYKERKGLGVDLIIVVMIAVFMKIGYSFERIAIASACVSVFFLIKLMKHLLNRLQSSKQLIIVSILISLILIFGIVNLMKMNQKAEFIQILEVKGNLLHVKTLEGEFQLKQIKDDLELLNSSDEKVSLFHNGTQLTSENEAFNKLEIEHLMKGSNHYYYSKRTGLQFIFDGTRFWFLDKYGKFVELDHSSRWGFEKLGHLFSSRGYIWSTSIPLLKNNILLGSGPDTFVFEFPQCDYKGKFNMFGNPYWIINKPHSLYLQIAIQTGVISLILYLVMNVRVLWETFWKNKHVDSRICLSKAIGLGVVSYLICSIFNDSSIGVSILYWTFLGILMGQVSQKEYSR